MKDDTRGPVPPALTWARSMRNSCEMGRRRVESLALPEHVHRVEAGRRVYFYYQVGRGRAPEQRGPRHRIAGDPHAPAGAPANIRFWAELNRLITTTVVYPASSLGGLVDSYRADDAFTRLADATRARYNAHLNRFQKPDAWGLLDIGSLTPFAVKTGRDALADTPVMANQMLAVGRTLYDWGMVMGLAGQNPFEKVPHLQVADRGHIPWPQWAIDYVIAKAPPDLVRMVRLGVATCQRESDLVRLGPENRATTRSGNGIWCRPKKTRRVCRSVFIPLAIADALELDRWEGEPMTFLSQRWGHASRHHRSDLYLYSPAGAPYTPGSLRARYHRWLASDGGQRLCKQWREWVGEMKRRYEWEADPEDAKGPTIHGLRGTGILARFAEGFDAGQIANDIGASRQTVDLYMRFRDQMEVAAAGRERLRLIKGEG